MRDATRTIRWVFLAAAPAILGAWACTGTVVETTGAGTTGAGGKGVTSTTGVTSATGVASTTGVTSATGATGGETSAGGAPGAGGSGGQGGAGGQGGTGGCPQGEMLCNGVCEDLSSDPANCGACGVACMLPNATAACAQGTCVIAACDSGWADCDQLAANGCEADLVSDPMNCGGCGMACIGGVQPCCSGTCGIDCPKGYAQCDPPPFTCADVCGTMLGTNQNCDFCGDACALQNSDSQCMPGVPTNVCTLVACDPGFGDCDMIAANGCEADLLTDPANCGTCGETCAPNQTCDQGTCQ